MNGAVTVASGMAGLGWRIRLVQPQAKVHARKGGVGPEDTRSVSRNPAMRSIEVEQDVLLGGRNKYEGMGKRAIPRRMRTRTALACFRKSKCSSNTASSCVFPTVTGRNEWHIMEIVCMAGDGHAPSCDFLALPPSLVTEQLVACVWDL